MTGRRQVAVTGSAVAVLAAAHVAAATLGVDQIRCVRPGADHDLPRERAR
jgi:hypothetical protein